MSIVVPLTTIADMFVRLTSKYSGSGKAMLMRKTGGTYVSLTYDDIRNQVERFTLALVDLGVQKGDKVAILSENRPEWVVVDMSSLSIGAVDVPLYPSQTAKQIEYILNDAGAVVCAVSNQHQLAKIQKIRNDVPTLRTVIVFNEDAAQGESSVVSFQSMLKRGGELLPDNEDILERTTANVLPEDLCTLIYTSGTTGNPKGVMLTHKNFCSNIHGSADAIQILDTDVMLSFLPLSHVFERMAGYYLALACGVSIAYAESIETVAENLKEVHPTIVCSVPRLFERIHNRIIRSVEKESPSKRRIFYWALEAGLKYQTAKKKNNVSPVMAAKHAIADKLVFSKLKERTGGKIRFFVSGGAALPRELGEFFEAVGILVLEGYGLTESSPVIAVNRIEKYKFGSVGVPLPNIEVKIAPDGEILTRGDHVMLGYWNDIKSTEEAIDGEGWLHTGDIGELDEHHFLSITDRKKHLFVSSGGKNIAPQPIENLFSGADFVDQLVLIGDKRMFLTALIYPDYTYLREYADAHHIKYTSNSDLSSHPDIYTMIEQRIQNTQKDLPNYERIRRFALLEQPLSIENGELTPTLKIKRKKVEERYRDIIEEMYHKIG